DGQVYGGPDGLVRLITESGADLVLNAIVGSAGLVPTVAALGEGIDLALANKESLVVGGELVTQLAEVTGAAIIPVDSEHSALHPQSIRHSLIQLCDGATLAHLGYPDMHVPISYALHYPERVDVPVRPLDLAGLRSLTFEPVDEQTFTCLRLARDAALAGGTA